MPAKERKTADESAAQRVLSWIRDHIESRGLAVGDLLPTEHEIAAATGAGRSSVREALTAMKALGIVRAKRKGGTRLVREPVLLGIREYLVDEYRTDARFRDAVAFRAALERGLAGYVVRNATAADVARLRRLVRDAADDQRTDLFVVETRFHMLMTAAARNRLAALMAHVYLPMFAFDRSVRVRPHVDRAYWVKRHLDLVDALEKRDEPAFIRLMERHTAPWVDGEDEG